MNEEVVRIVDLERVSEKPLKERINELNKKGLNEDASIIVALGEKPSPLKENLEEEK